MTSSYLNTRLQRCSIIPAFAGTTGERLYFSRNARISWSLSGLIR